MYQNLTKKWHRSAMGTRDYSKNWMSPKMKFLTAIMLMYVMSVTSIVAQTDSYSPYRESNHFIFDIPTSYLTGNITPANLGRFMSHMDDLYEAYTTLMGGHTPCNGQKLTFVASNAGYGWLWVYGGSPYIYWNDGLVASDLKQINDKDVWFWGTLHEIGHLFDKETKPDWFFHAEVTANLKAIYAIATIPDCQVEMNGIMRRSLQDIYNYFYDWSVQDDGDDDRYTDKISLGFINVANKYGWNVFTQTFNSYWDNSYPNAGCNADGAGKYNEFINRLEYFSGSANIRTECFSTNNWQATIEQHYPQNSTPSWQIGTPKASDITASFNCSNGALTISGVGAMQDWIYNNTTMPWASVREQITSVVINEGVTSIGNYAFMECTALTVVLPNSITQIGAYAFLGCNSLTDVTVNWQTPLLVSNIFDRVNVSKVNLHVPSGTAYLYKETPIWKDFKIVEIKTCEDKLQELQSENEALLQQIAELQAQIVVLQEALENCGSTNIQTVKANALNVYPNPTTGELIIESGEQNIDNVIIYDSVGQVVEIVRATSVQNNGNITLNISHLLQGTYFLQINNKVVKVIKK